MPNSIGPVPFNCPEDEGALRLIEVLDPIRGSMQFAYDDEASEQSVYVWSDEATNWVLTTTTVYNELGQTESVAYAATTASAAVTIAYVYAKDGQLLSEVATDENDDVLRRTDYEYDALGRRTFVIQVAGERDDELNEEDDDLTSETVYDNLGRVIAQIDPLGHATLFDFDELSRLIAQTDAEEGETLFFYDPAGNRTDLVDPVGNNTHWEYDELNRVASETQQDEYDGNDLGTRSFIYDANGNLIRRVDREGRVIDYGYDASNRRTHEYWFTAEDAPDDPVALGDPADEALRTITSQYDAAGRLLSIIDWQGEGPAVPAGWDTGALSGYDYAYDRFDRVTDTTIQDADQPDVVISVTYDGFSRRDTVSADIDGTADFTTDYDYDAYGRLARISQAEEAGESGQNAVAAKWAEFGYNGLGQVVSLNRGTDTDPVVVTTYQYDAYARLETLQHRLGDGESSSGDPDDLIAGYDYGYDAASRITSFDISGWSDESADFDYDDTNQLTDADRDGTTNDEDYDYDANGNRDSSGYTTDPHNRTTSDGTFDYGYDLEGNRTSKVRISTGPADDRTVEYEWDHRNRLTTVIFKDNSGDVTKRIEYQYDPFDHLVRKLLDTTAEVNGLFNMADASAERYAYDGNQIALEFSGSNGSTLDVSRRAMWSDQVDQLLAQEHFNASLNEVVSFYWSLADHQNTIRDLLDAQGFVVAHFGYDSFGRIVAAVDGSSANITDVAVLTRYLYTARPFDFDSQLQSNWHRWFDHGIAKWTSEDWILDDTNNTYRYIKNGPFDGLDWTGFGTYIIGNTGEPEIRWDDFYHYDPTAVAQTSDYKNWAIYFGLLNTAEAAGYIPDGTRAYRHYRNNTGTDLHVNYYKAYKEDATIRFDVDAEIASAMSEAERLWKVSGLTKFAMTGTAVHSQQPATENWIKAIGYHRLWGSALVKVEPESKAHDCKPRFVMDIYVHMLDKYNFNPGEQDIQSGLEDDENGRFEKLGWAKSFISYGSLRRTVEWTGGGTDTKDQEWAQVTSDVNERRGTRDRNNRGVREFE